MLVASEALRAAMDVAVSHAARELAWDIVTAVAAAHPDALLRPFAPRTYTHTVAAEASAALADGVSALSKASLILVECSLNVLSFDIVQPVLFDVF